MIKRPLGIYPVALWVFIMLLLYVLLPLSRFNPPGPPSNKNQLLRLVILIAFCLCIWAIINLIRLKKSGRLIAVILLAYGALIIPINMILLSLNHRILSFRLRVIIVLLGTVALNVLSIVYLSRPKFLALCRDYRNQAQMNRNMLKPK